MRFPIWFFVGILLSVTAFAGAELCPECRTNGPYTKDIGNCTRCKDGRTTSGQFQLCHRCAVKLHQCEHCLKSLAPATQSAIQSATQPVAQIVAPIDRKKDDTYKVGSWEYRYTVTNRGTKSEGYVGQLMYNGSPLTEPESINDYYQTPWGPIYWVGRPQVMFGGHEWMPSPKASAPVGKRIDIRDRDVTKPTTQANVPAAKVDITQPGTYRAGDWEYRLIVTSPGSKSEGTIGKLFHGGKPVPDAAIGDYYRTPWGKIVWVGNPAVLWGEHGWVASPALISEGRELKQP